MIALSFLTFNRPDYAPRVLESLGRHLRASEPLWCHIADDGSSQSYRDDLLSLAHHIWGDHVSISNSERAGYGASFNLATQYTHAAADVIMPIEDDWLLVKALNLDPLAAAVRTNALTQCIRLGYLGFTQPLHGTLVCANEAADGSNVYLALNPDSPERHVLAGHPRIESVEWERAVGPWPEGLDPNQTEWAVCGLPAARTGVAWPLWLQTSGGDYFAHIGAERAR